jgi:hypothetical protein
MGYYTAETTRCSLGESFARAEKHEKYVSCRRY